MAQYSPDERRDHPEIYRVPTEEDVPNSERVVPSSRLTVLVLSGLVCLLIVAAVTVLRMTGNASIALVLAVVGVAAGVLGIILARGDARVSMATPIVATGCAAILAIIVAMDAAEVDEALEGAEPASAIIGPDADEPPARTAPRNVDPAP
jgi:lysylphosphatidylglycerol synthetase-like protein (DUF2156 family)